MVSSGLVLPESEDFATPMLGKTRGINGQDFLNFSRHLKIPEKAYVNIFLRYFKGKRTIGKLINDTDIYRDTKTTLNKLEKAADGITDAGAISTLGTVTGTLF